MDIFSPVQIDNAPGSSPAGSAGLLRGCGGYAGSVCGRPPAGIFSLKKCIFEVESKGICCAPALFLPAGQLSVLLSLQGSVGSPFLAPQDAVGLPGKSPLLRLFKFLLPARAAHGLSLGKGGDPFLFPVLAPAPRYTRRRALDEQHQGADRNAKIDQDAPRDAEGAVEKAGKPAAENAAAQGIFRTEFEGRPCIKGCVQGDPGACVQIEMGRGLKDQDQDRARQQPCRHLSAARLCDQIQAQHEYPHRYDPGADSETAEQDPGKSTADAAAESGQGKIDQDHGDDHDNKRDSHADLALSEYRILPCLLYGLCPAGGRRTGG